MEGIEMWIDDSDGLRAIVRVDGSVVPAPPEFEDREEWDMGFLVGTTRVPLSPPNPPRKGWVSAEGSMLALRVLPLEADLMSACRLWEDVKMALAVPSGERINRYLEMLPEEHPFRSAHALVADPGFEMLGGWSVSDPAAVARRAQAIRSHVSALDNLLPWFRGRKAGAVRAEELRQLLPPSYMAMLRPGGPMGAWFAGPADA